MESAARKAVWVVYAFNDRPPNIPKQPSAACPFAHPLNFPFTAAAADTVNPVPDAKLTQLGKQQSRELNELTKSTYQRTANLLVSSPMRRPLETLILGYPELKKRLETEEGGGKPVIILDILQEVARHACDTPTYPPEAIKNDPDLGGIFADLDFSGLSPDYASKKGIFAPENITQRATAVRKWLIERPEQEIVGEYALPSDLCPCLCNPTSHRLPSSDRDEVFLDREAESKCGVKSR